MAYASFFLGNKKKFMLSKKRKKFVEDTAIPCIHCKILFPHP